MAQNRSLTARWHQFRLRRETPLPLDQARYLSVSTGRLEPYLRALADQPLYTTHSPETHVADDGTLFLPVYASSLRARAQGPAHPVAHPSLSPLLENAINTGQGLLVDSGLATELTVEPRHLPRVRALISGEKTADAFTPIGDERLASHAPTPAELAALKAGPLGTWAAELAAHQIHACVANVQLYGFGGAPTWHAIYLVDSQDCFVGCPAHLLPPALPRTLLVDPKAPGWERNLLWEYRTDAMPLTRPAPTAKDNTPTA